MNLLLCNFLLTFFFSNFCKKKISGLKDIQELEEIIGESKGIQGHNNSCYLDATLFSMFTFAQCFDSLLYRPADKKVIFLFNLWKFFKNNLKLMTRTYKITIRYAQYFVMKLYIRYENIISFERIKFWNFVYCWKKSVKWPV